MADKTEVTMGDLFQELIKGHIEQLEKEIFTSKARVEELERQLAEGNKHIRMMLSIELCAGSLYPPMIKRNAEDFLKRTEES